VGSTQGTKAELEQGLYWMGQGKIKAAIDSTYSFEQAAEAHTKMLTGKGLFGKILLKPEGAYSFNDPAFQKSGGLVLEIIPDS